jgi:PhoPQ-activated pathogenicity-related protein
MTEFSRLTRSRFLLGSLGAAASSVFPSIPALGRETTALDRYIAAADSEYGYRLVSTLQGEGCTGYVLEMISQRWRQRSEVDQPIWKHWLTIVKPDLCDNSVGALVIGGGSNNDRPPGRVNTLLALLAQRTHSVVSELQMIPNQPLTFARETKARSEDDLIAYSWDKYLRTGDETWPLRLPMTKSVVRAMDSITDFCARGSDPLVVNRFIVGGSSKRGWTTWTTAAVDPRVVGIVPVVIDTLNVAPSVEHVYRAYGCWPPALRPYEEMGILKWVGTHQLAALMHIEDPYTYRTRLTMPKLIINATGDEYFVPDCSQYYFGSLPGDKYLRYVPNADHSLHGAGVDAAHSVLAFYHSIVDGTPRPDFAWSFEGERSIRVDTGTRPSTVRLWHAVNPSGRDFRLATIGRAFTNTNLRDLGGGTYVGTLVPPAKGWSASFVELTFETPEGDPFRITTGVRVLPDVLPYGPPGRHVCTA